MRDVVSAYQQRSCSGDSSCWFLQSSNSGLPNYSTSENGANAPAHDPRLISTTTTESGREKQSAYGYDNNNNRTDDYEYDWGSGSVGGLLTHAVNSYNTSSSYTSLNILDLPSEVKIYNGAGTLQADTQYGYDANSVTGESGIIGHDNGNFSGGGARGNMTSIARCTTPGSCGWLTTNLYFDVAGSAVKVTDANGHSTSYGYADNYSDGVNRNTYGHVTSKTNALGQAEHWQWDFGSGKVTEATDLSGVNTIYSYGDALDRLTQARRAAGLTSFETQTNVVYSSPMDVNVYNDQNAAGDEALRTERLYDGFGRVVQTNEYEGGGSYIARTKTYDALGRVLTTSNPSRPGDGLNYATTYGYDALGRTTAVTTADGAVARTSYAGVYTTATDQAGNSRVMQTDALGRLTAVWENPSGFNYETSYAYDALGDLTQVSQGAEARSFTYDGLGRLKSSTQPESGSTSYAYDGVGNVKTKVDARNITTSYSYDTVNRVLQKSYSDGTATASYGYDAAGAGYSWGHLTQVSNANATTNYASIDPLGRVTASNQQTAGGTYGFTYYYNRAGSLYYETYPSGRAVATGYDGANRASAVTGSYAGHGKNYVPVVSYWPHGGVEKREYGNNVWRTYTFNNRLQTNAFWDAIYDNPNYFLFLEDPIGYGTTNNNGNVLNATLTPVTPYGSISYYNQSFTYDALNRLATASDSGGWSRNFGYDQYGNGWVTGTPTGMGYGPATPAWNVYNTKNQIGSSPYDAAGNMLGLPPGMAFGYDAENRQVWETNSGGLNANYYYDADGKRVKKVLSSGAVIAYIYDALGNLAAEYGSASGGAPPCTTCYYSYDHLGSLRMVTDQNASVIARHDYLPFGDEIPGGVAGRSGQFGAFDNASQRFTGKERDTETSLDYFGARYYGAGMERFMSADEPLLDQDEHDPQSWNLYAYVRNSPLRNVDLDGRKCSFAKDNQGRTIINDLDGAGCSELHDNTVHGDEPGLLMLAGIGEQMNNGHAWAQFVSDAGRATASVMAPRASAVAECVTPGGNCDKTNLAMAVIPGALGKTGRVIKVLEDAGGVIHLEIQTAQGTYEVVANITREGDTIVLSGAHIEGAGDGQFGGPALLKELRAAARQFMEQEGATRVEVRPGIRSSGANPGRAMRPFTVER